MDDLGTAEVGRLLGEALNKAFGRVAKTSGGANAQAKADGGAADTGNAPTAIG